jgi:hypothetical protein
MRTQVRNISAKDVAGLVKEGWVVLDVRPPTETNRAPVANSVHVSTWTVFTLQLAPAGARPSILYPICIAGPMFPLSSVTLGSREILEQRRDFGVHGVKQLTAITAWRIYPMTPSTCDAHVQYMA